MIDKIFWIVDQSLTLVDKAYKIFKKKDKETKPVNPLTFKDVQHIQNQINSAVEASRKKSHQDRN